MLIPGSWIIESDGIERPMLHAEALAASGNWVSVDFLIDTGADRTILHSSMIDFLELEREESSDQYSGIGGRTETVSLDTRVKLTRSDGAVLLLNGPFPACTDPLATDCSILGRDVLKLFTLIADPFTKTLSLIRDRHRYHVFEA